MAAFTGYRSLLIEIVTRDTELVGCCLVPALDVPVILVVALPALVLGQLFMFEVAEFKGFITHFEFDNVRPFLIGPGCLQIGDAKQSGE
jgi:hypothetical protein